MWMQDAKYGKNTLKPQKTAYWTKCEQDNYGKYLFKCKNFKIDSKQTFDL